MASIIKKPSAVGSDTVYYVGGNLWSDDRSSAKSFVDESAANAVMVNTDGTNGGWAGATVENE